jgi:hypothetical protein
MSLVSGASRCDRSAKVHARPRTTLWQRSNISNPAQTNGVRPGSYAEFRTTTTTRGPVTATTPPSPTPAPSAGTTQDAIPDPLTVGKWVHDIFSSDATPTVIALLALGLSLIALVNQFSRGRKADLSVRFAKTPDYKYKADRLVITNHGAASAKNIKLDLIVNLEAQAARPHGVPEVIGGEQPWKPYRDDEHPFPIKVLAPGASLYIPISVIGHRPEEAAFPLAKLTWKDKRIRRQSWTSTVSSTGQILGGQSIENFYAEKQARLMSLLP